jgi:hypothetical protein
VTTYSLFYPEGGVGQTQAWMPTYVSILRTPQMIWVLRATVEWYWQEKTEELGEKPVPVPLCPPKIPYGLTRGVNPGLSGDRPATNDLCHGTAQTYTYIQTQRHKWHFHRRDNLKCQVNTGSRLNLLRTVPYFVASYSRATWNYKISITLSPTS